MTTLNGLLRRILLSFARNAWLRDHLPRLPFMRRAVRRFMPGEDASAALAAARPLQAAGIGTIYTRLGENLETLADADAVAAHYLDLLGRFRDAGIDGEISVKPTQLGLDIDPEAMQRHLEALAAKAAEVGSYLWIDMESSEYVERTIVAYERLRVSHPATGICLQAYLRRTAADVQRLLPLGPAIRLVKGAYDEPAAVAYRSKAEVDSNFAAVAVSILRASRSASAPPARLGLGTHDTRLVAQIADHAAAAGVAKAGFEVQMLYGIRAAEQLRLARDGLTVRTLIAYGEAWYPWYMRRLAERPANVLFALRQLLP